MPAMEREAARAAANEREFACGTCVLIHEINDREAVSPTAGKDSGQASFILEPAC
jgi:hypothetical protein